MSFKSKQRAKHSHLFGEDPLNASAADDPLFGSSGRSSSPLSRSTSSTTSNAPLSVVGDPLSSSTPSAPSRTSPISSNSSSPRQPAKRLPQTNGKVNNNSNNNSSIFGDIDVSKLGRRSPRPSDSPASPSPPPPPPRTIKQQQQQQQPPPPPPRTSSVPPPEEAKPADAARPPSPPQSARQSREEPQPDLNQPQQQPQRQSLFSRFIKSSSSSSSSISSTKSDDTPTKPSQKPPPPPVPPRQQQRQQQQQQQSPRQPPLSPQARPPVPDRRPAVPPRKAVQNEEHESDEEDNQLLVPTVVIEDEATRAFAADADTFNTKVKPTRLTYDDDPELLASLTQDLRFDDRPAPALSVSTPTHAAFDDDDVVADPWSVPPAAFFNNMSRIPVGSTSSPLLKSNANGNSRKVSVNDIDPSKRSAFSDLIDSWNGQPKHPAEATIDHDQRQQQFLKRVAAEQRDVGFAGIRENAEEEAEEEEEKRPMPTWDIEDTNPWR
ncbi:hypothetical protein BCR43DRAFT_485701 [Syncephalastrum racemosum]|uniref:Uncharacterized protein n=1 Tax=Syncephalastrum racemosum TaxID=13706 RepID=A0A1X2HMV8_SYNRA|nr:hypothetical protein BCR43DRAFT_485701 [Syncephalastrum racemosum]